VEIVQIMESKTQKNGAIEKESADAGTQWMHIASE